MKNIKSGKTVEMTLYNSTHGGKTHKREIIYNINRNLKYEDGYCNILNVQ